MISYFDVEALILSPLPSAVQLHDRIAVPENSTVVMVVLLSDP
jgi:hypothetical protein